MPDPAAIVIGRRKRLSQRDIDALQMNYEEGREIEADWAKALAEIAKDLPGYVVPSHDANCASCTIGAAIRALAAHHLGPEHRLARALPKLFETKPRSRTGGK